MANDLKLKNVWCPFCDITFDPAEEDEAGFCPGCDRAWWADPVWKVEWNEPPVDAAHMRKFKGIHSAGPNWYSIEWEWDE